MGLGLMGHGIAQTAADKGFEVSVKLLSVPSFVCLFVCLFACLFVCLLTVCVYVFRLWLSTVTLRLSTVA